MKRILKCCVLLALSGIAGCADTTVDDINKKPVQIFYSTKPAEEVRDCLLRGAAAQGAGPVTTNDLPNRTEISVDMGMVRTEVLYVLAVEPYQSGSKIEVRYDDEAYGLGRKWSEAVVSPCRGGDFTQ